MHKIQFKFQKSLSFWITLPLDPAGGLSFLRPLLHVHPLVQFLNTPLVTDVSWQKGVRTKTTQNKTFQTKDPLTKAPDKSPPQLRENLYRGLLSGFFVLGLLKVGGFEMCDVLWGVPGCVTKCDSGGGWVIIGQNSVRYFMDGLLSYLILYYITTHHRISHIISWSSHSIYHIISSGGSRGTNPAMSPTSLAIDFSSLQWRNKREILGNILKCPSAAEYLDPLHDISSNQIFGSVTEHIIACIIKVITYYIILGSVLPFEELWFPNKKDIPPKLPKNCWKRSVGDWKWKLNCPPLANAKPLAP